MCVCERRRGVDGEEDDGIGGLVLVKAREEGAKVSDARRKFSVDVTFCGGAFSGEQGRSGLTCPLEIKRDLTSGNFSRPCEFMRSLSSQHPMNRLQGQSSRSSAMLRKYHKRGSRGKVRLTDRVGKIFNHSRSVPDQP